MSASFRGLIARAAGLAALAAMTAATAPSAHAGSLVRLEDGRLELKILGERMIFHDSDVEERDSVFSTSSLLVGCNPKSSISINTSFAAWLADPKAADCIDERLPSDRPTPDPIDVSLDVSYFQEGPIVYPGPIRREDAITFLYSDPQKRDPKGNQGLSNGFKINILSDRIVAITRFCNKSDLRSVSLRPYSAGPTWYTQGAGGVLPAADRIGSVEQDLCVGCAVITLSNCHIVLVSQDKHVTIDFEWYQDNPPVPRMEWVRFDATAREIAQSIFADRPPGDFQ